MRKNRFNLFGSTILIMLIAFSIFMRLSELDWGFPLQLHPDEPMVTEPARHMLFTGDITPTLFNRPNHISIYLSAIAYTLYTPVEKGATIQDSYQSLQHLLVSRAMVAIQSVLLLIVVFLWGYIFVNRNFALLVTSVVGFLSIIVIHGHYVTPEVPSSLYIICIWLFASLFLKYKKTYSIYLMAFFHAWAILEKYPGLLAGIIPLLTVAIVSKSWKEFFLLGIRYLVALIISIGISSPTFWFNLDKVYEAIVFEGRDTHLGADGKNFFQKLVFYTNILLKELGIFIFLATISKCVQWLIGRYRTNRISQQIPSLSPTRIAIRLLFIFGVFYWLALCTLGLHWERWLVPVVIPFAVTGVYFIYHWSSNIKYVVLVIVILSNANYALTSYTDNFRVQKTIPFMTDAIKEWGIPFEQIAGDGYTPLHPRTPRFVFRDQIINLKKQGKKYLLLSSTMFGRVLREAEHPYLGMYKHYLRQPMLIKVSPHQKQRYGIKNKWLRSLCIRYYEPFKFNYSYYLKNEPLLSGPELRLVYI